MSPEFTNICENKAMPPGTVYKESTQKSKRYGPGYSHVLTSLKEKEAEYYEAVFPKGETRYTTAKTSDRKARKTSTGLTQIRDINTVSRTKLVPLSSTEFGKTG